MSRGEDLKEGRGMGVRKEGKCRMRKRVKRFGGESGERESSHPPATSTNIGPFHSGLRHHSGLPLPDFPFHHPAPLFHHEATRQLSAVYDQQSRVDIDVIDGRIGKAFDVDGATKETQRKTRRTRPLDNVRT